MQVAKVVIKDDYTINLFTIYEIFTLMILTHSEDTNKSSPKTLKEILKKHKHRKINNNILQSGNSPL